MSTAIMGIIEERKAGLAISAAQAWMVKPSTTLFSVPIKNKIGCSLRLIGQVNHGSPHRFQLMLLDSATKRGNLFRLCARGKHRNKHSDGRRWNWVTHLHVWIQEYADTHAIDPGEPWPPSAWNEGSREPLTGTEMRDLFGTFCGMLGIRCDVSEFWQDPPPLPSAGYITLTDGEEIP